MRKGLSLPATVEALQLFIPCPIYGELVVKGDDCPSWRGSLVEFKIWLNKRRSEMADSHMKHSKKNRNHDKTANGTTLPGMFFLWPVENPPSVQNSPLKLYCIRSSLNRRKMSVQQRALVGWALFRQVGGLV